MPRPRPARLRALLVSFVLASACGSPPGETAPTSSNASRMAPEPGESAVDAPHVVFTAPAIVLDRLGVPVAPPVSGPSRPSPATLATDDPSVVRVDGAGRLVAVARGKTRVRSLGLGGAVLDVEVRPAAALAISPARLAVEPGRSAPLRLHDPTTGDELPAAAATWASSSPRVVVVRDGVAYAGMEPGEAALTARYGGVEATIPASVGAGARLRLDPDLLRLRVGEARQLRAFAGAAAVSAEWRSRDARVVAAGPLGLVLALAPGKTSVCAALKGERACTSVEVAP